MGSDRLCGLVSDTLQHDPLSGALSLFINRLRARMQVLYWGELVPSVGARNISNPRAD